MTTPDVHKRQTSPRDLGRGAIVGLSLGAACTLVEFADRGFGFGVAGPLLLGMGSVLAACSAVVASVAWAVRRHPDLAEIASLGVLFLAVAVPVMRYSIDVRHQAFVDLAERAGSVTEAIERFAADQRHPPRSLDELVPKYLASLPTTGLRAHPKFQYQTERESPWVEGPWELSVDVPWGLSFDKFFYWPSHQYPETIYGGRVERFGQWAYVHE